MKILKQLSYEDILFIDCETVAAVPKLEPNTPLWDSWAYKVKAGLGNIDDKQYIANEYLKQAALYPEFNRVVCISIGKVKDGVLKLKSFVNTDEKQLLKDFCTVLNSICAANKKTLLAGFALKGFDIPTLMRKCIIHQIELPSLLDTGHLKPWELTAVDMMELWKGTSFNNASLLNVCVALGLENPKEEIAGYQTTDFYYNKPNGLEIIQQYCEGDVLSSVNIFRACRFEPAIKPEVGDIKIKQVGVLNRIFNKGEMDKKEEAEIVRNYNKLDDKEKLIADEILETVKTK